MFHPGLLLLSQIISRAVVKVVIPTDRYVNKSSSFETFVLLKWPAVWNTTACYIILQEVPSLVIRLLRIYSYSLLLILFSIKIS